MDVRDKDIDELDRTVPNNVFNIGPELLTADKVNEIAPNLVTILRELKREPQCKLVIFRICMTDHYSIAHCGRFG